MFQHDRLNNELTFWQKIKELDYILLTSVFLLSILSLFVMYSTDGGEILFHTKSHFSKLIIFFPLMIFIAFFNIKWWHNLSYLFYLFLGIIFPPCAAPQLLNITKYYNLKQQSNSDSNNVIVHHSCKTICQIHRMSRLVISICIPHPVSIYKLHSKLGYHISLLLIQVAKYL